MPPQKQYLSEKVLRKTNFPYSKYLGVSSFFLQQDDQTKWWVTKLKEIIFLLRFIEDILLFD